MNIFERFFKWLEKGNTRLSRKSKYPRPKVIPCGQGKRSKL